jgi:glycosyltransferase EpsD
MLAGSPKVLFVATVARHIKAFHIPCLKFFKEKGYEVHIAANCTEEVNITFADKIQPISIARKPFELTNFRAYFQLKRILNEHDFDIVHFHIPVSAAVGRLAARKARKNGTTVIYTAHGFNFFKGSSFLSWLLYFNIEKYLAKYTDCLITINSEDFECASNHKFSAKRLEKINGMGVDFSKFYPVDHLKKQELRAKHNFNQNDFILVYAAEFSKRKNQEWLINVLPEIKKQIPNIHLLLPGCGETQKYCENLVKLLNLQNNVTFLGFRKDIDEIIKLSDVGVSSSKNEGLGLHLVEYMACGKPIIATNLQGHKDLIKENFNGHLVDIDDRTKIIVPLVNLYNNRELYNKMSINALEYAKLFSLETSMSQLASIYNNYINYKGVKVNDRSIS